MVEGDDAPEARHIVNLEHSVISAVQRRDRASLEELLGDDFTLTTGRPGHEVRTRDEWLDVTANEYVIDDYRFEELTIQHYGWCAVARSRYRQHGRMGDQPRNSVYRMTDVWVHGPDGWRLQARHAHRVEGD